MVSLLVIASLLGVPSVFYGEALGLSRISVLFGAVVGSMLGVTTNLLASDFIVRKMRDRAEARGKASRLEKLSERAEPLLDRAGMLGLAFAGPIVLGTFGTALAAPAFGVPRLRVFVALLIGVTFWCVVFVVAADLLVGRYGVQE